MSVSKLKKRRGVPKGSISKLSEKIGEIEAATGILEVKDTAQRYKEKLIALDAEFRTHHYSIVDAVDGEDALAIEQAILDEHDELVSQLMAKLDKIIKANTPISMGNSRDMLSRKLSRLSRTIKTMNTEIQAIPTDTKDSCLIEQYTDRLAELKSELKTNDRELLELGLADTDELFNIHSQLSRLIFECGHQLKKLSNETEIHSNHGVRLPKLEVPTFDGNVLNWTTFWEQFSISVHDRPSISDPEKLVYLRQAIKDGSAKHAIEGLSCSGDHYKEAVECLKLRYDQPRLIHRTHVQMIMEASPLKEGTGREIRRLHDKVQQHLRALKSMGQEPNGSFVTSVLELKLDANTMFEWQKHTQEVTDIPSYMDLLDFLNMRAQASEVSDQGKRPSRNESLSKKQSGKIASFVASTSTVNCVLCKNDKHPLYVCSKFKNLTHSQMVAIVKEHSLCMNCLRPGHFAKQCKSLHHCRKCQNPHHTLLHVDRPETVTTPTGTEHSNVSHVVRVSTSMASGVLCDSLLMTCCVHVEAPDGSVVRARALLDSASSASFISDRLANSLSLPLSNHKISISGIAGLSHNSQNHTTTQFTIRSMQPARKSFEVNAVVVPKVTCELPFHPVPFDPSWKHLYDVPLADPSFGQPGRIDLLLGVDIYVEVLLQGRRFGAPNAPDAFETEFGWVLAGNSGSKTTTKVSTNHTVLQSTDDLIRKFWETEESPSGKMSLTPEEKFVVDHFKANHYRDGTGRFVIPLPKKTDSPTLGESRSQAVKRFTTLEKTLHYKGKVQVFNEAVSEYFKAGHAEEVPETDKQKPASEVFYLPMHLVYKESSSTTKVRVVFDASSKSSTGVSLNDLLLVGPSVHSTLMDVLLRFRLYRVALVADVSRMYRAVKLAEPDKDLHHFVWRPDTETPLRDFRMTRVTFGVSASPFAANMAVKQNGLDFSVQYPLAAKAVHKSFYVDDCLSGADTVSGAVEMQTQLQQLFEKGGFLLRKWDSSEKAVLENIPPDLVDDNSVHRLSDPEQYTKTLGIQWSSCQDSF